jgi:DNA-binding transcriptional ArsR family regulator
MPGRRSTLQLIHLTGQDIARLRILPTLWPLIENCVEHPSPAEGAASEWSEMQALIDADRARRARTMLAQGIAGLFATLHPRVRWAPPFLQVLDDTDAVVHLDGRGLVLAPSLFLGQPTVLLDASGGRVLTYPVDITAGAGPAPELARLLGHTRAALLNAIGDGITGSTELGLRAAVSRTAVSRHARLLREAGLVLTLQYGSIVRHTLTERGTVLLGRVDPTADLPIANDQLSQTVMHSATAATADSVDSERLNESKQEATCADGPWQ